MRKEEKDKRKIISITLLMGVIILCEYYHPINAITQDLGRHILTGKIIATTHTVPKVNLLSYTYPNFPFINHHWLSEVIFFILSQQQGFQGILFVTTTAVIMAAALVFLYAKKRVSWIPLAITSLLYSGILSERTEVRPEVFSFLFLALFIVILYTYKDQKTKLIYLLIPLELLWVNTHIYFIIGPLVTALFCIDIGIQEKSIHTQKEKWLLTTTIGVFLVTLLNPNGITGALYPLTVLTKYGYPIEENQNIFFLQQVTGNPIIIVFEVTAVILILLLIYNRKKTSLIDWLLSITFILLGAQAIRNLPLFVFGTYIPCARYAEKIAEKAQQKIGRRKQIITYGIYTSIIIIGIGIIIQSIQTRGIGASVPTGAKNAVDFYKKNHIQGRVFNNFDIGSYLEYQLYPQKVFVDGRPEAYPVSFFQNIYIPMQESTKNFNQADAIYQFNSIFFAHTDQTPWAETFIQNIVANPLWKIVYLDDTVIILVKNDKQNQAIIQKYPGDITVSNYQPQNLNSLQQLAHVFSIVNWKDQEITIDKAIIKINKTYCPALLNLAQVSMQQNAPDTSIQIQQYNQICRGL